MSTATDYIEEVNEGADSPDLIPRDSAVTVVIGTGPVGMRFVDEMVTRDPDCAIVVYGSEPERPYNRVLLSNYLAGSSTREDLRIDEHRSDRSVIEYRYNCAIVRIDRDRKTVRDETGREQRYQQLVLATGSSPFIPSIENVDYKGVYTFRTLGEADELMTRKVRSRHTVVLGGGLLGLETAKAMQRFNTEITVIEQGSWLMMQQLDEAGGRLLEDRVRDAGIHVITGDSVFGIEGDGRVESVVLRSGHSLECDTLIIAAGIRSNALLASHAGIACGKGIKVDAGLRTSDPDIYAIGECAEYDDTVYGLVQPGYDQAAVLADRLNGGHSRFSGAISATKLKVMSHSVFSTGRTGVYEESGSSVDEYVFTDHDAGIYRKIRIFGNRLIGVVAVGDWHETTLLNDLVERHGIVWPWQIFRFKRDGSLWGEAVAADVVSWPEAATVCSCTGVTRGGLTTAIASGCDSVECLSKTTRAGSVCGSCKPLLSELLGTGSVIEPLQGWRGLLGLSAVAMCLAALFFLIWQIPYPDTVQVDIRWDVIWRDTLFKQISGFSILGLVAIGLVISLRKRMNGFQLGEYRWWRVAHVVLGVAALTTLIAHTGFRLGSEMNLLLMINFLLIAGAGAYASTVVATEHRSAPAVAKKQRKRWNTLHMVLFWPMPVLLGFHVLKTYYY